MVTLFYAATFVDVARFNTFVEKYNKSYLNEDEKQKRRRIYLQNLKRINEHNSAYDIGLNGYRLAENNLTDLTEEEFTERYLGLNFYKVANQSLDRTGNFFDVWELCPSSEEVPVSNVDWSKDEDNRWMKQKQVTSVRDQGFCGSCWAFSAVGALEAANYRYKCKHNNNTCPDKVQELSESDLLNCVYDENSGGCEGGYPATALEHVKYNGIVTSEEAPYAARREDCDGDHINTRKDFQLSGYCQVRTDGNKDDELKKALANVGPVSSLMCFPTGPMHFMSSDIMDDLVACKAACTDDPVNHAVVVVGYGTEKDRHGVDKDFWLIKNSAGTSWGDKVLQVCKCLRNL